MADLKSRLQNTQETSPNLTVGMRITKILSCEFKDTQYKKPNGSPQQVAILKVDMVGNGQKIETYHTTAGAIVSLLYDYFVKDKMTEPLEKSTVKELRSKQGRNYLVLASD